MSKDQRRDGRGSKKFNPAHKTPPPEHTGEEAKFLFDLRERQTTVVGLLHTEIRYPLHVPGREIMEFARRRRPRTGD